MNSRVCKRLRQAVWGPEGEDSRQYNGVRPKGAKKPGVVRVAGDFRRRYQSFKRAFLSFPWNQRHTAFTIRKTV